MDELTGRQRELLRFISKEIKNGLPPTIREIGDELGIESTLRRGLPPGRAGKEGLHRGDPAQCARDSAHGQGPHRSRVVRMKPTFANLIAATASRAQLSQAVTRAALEAFFVELSIAVWVCGRCLVPGLGVFKVRTRTARKVLDPGKPAGRYMGQRVHYLPAHRSVYARVAKSWRRRG